MIVVLEPVPAMEPGLRVHVPDPGRPFNNTLPVGEAHDTGCATEATTGASGAAGAAIILTLIDSVEIQPASLVTLKE